MRELKDRTIDTVIIASRWLQYAEGGDNRQPLSVSARKNDLYTAVPTDPEKVLAAYVATVRTLLRTVQKVILIYPVPESEWNIPKSMVKLALSNDLEPFSLAIDNNRVSQRLNKINEVFDAIGIHPNLVRIRPEQILCGTYIKNSCVTHLAGIPLYFDNEHLSNDGARLVVGKIMDHIGS